MIFLGAVPCGMLSRCHALLTCQSGSACSRPARPRRCSTCPASGVGHATVWRDEADPPDGRGVARTGVTVLDPGGNCFRRPVPAGGAVLNGAGECTGFLSMQEWGLAETPVFLTSTMHVGRVYDAACEVLAEEEPAIGVEDVIIPLVAECDDSFLSDARRMQVASDGRARRPAAGAALGGHGPAARRGRGGRRHRA